MDPRADTPFSDTEAERRYYETLIEASPIAIVTCDPDLIVTPWNPVGDAVTSTGDAHR